MWSGSTNSTSPRHCRSMTVFFNSRNGAGVDAAVGAGRLREHHVQIDQAQAVGHVGQLLGREIGDPRKSCPRVAQRLKRQRASRSGSGTSIVATCGLCTSRSLTSARRSAIRQNAMFTCLMSGFCAQRRKRTSRAPCPRASGVQIARRHQVLGIVEQHGDALPRGRVVDQVPLDEAVQQEQGRVGIARPGRRIAPARR